MNEFELGQVVCTRGIANATGAIPVKKMLEVTTKL